MNLSPINIGKEQSAWGEDDSITFFSRERNTFEDLYPSEKVFLPNAVKCASNVLDVGCACGGFSAIMHSLNEDIRYTGIDIIPEMLIRAKTRYNNSAFAAAAGHQLPFDNQSFDLVHCSGATHLNSRYQEFIADMWRVTRHQMLFDVRLSKGPTKKGTFRVDFEKSGAGRLLPYIVINIDEMRDLVDGLVDGPTRISLDGYNHPASTNADLPDDGDLIMAFLLLSRSSAKKGWQINIEDRATK